MSVCNVPIYIDITVEDQINDLMTFLKQLIKKPAGELNDEAQPTTTVTGKSKNTTTAATTTGSSSATTTTATASNNENVTEIVNIFEIVFNELPESELEIILNNIVSVLVIIDMEKNNDLMILFCSKLLNAAANENKSTLRPVLLRVLWLLFQALDKSNTIRCAIYEKVLEMGMLADRFQSIYKSFAKFQKLFEDISENCDEMRSLYRKLYEILIERNESEEALKVIMKLLSTYTDDGNAIEAKSDAIKCVLLAIADKNTFLFEPLLDLKPVQRLEGDPIYNLLRIFVSESYQVYVDFYKKHVDLIRKQWKLDHEQNLRKMRQLTFMQLVEDCTEITFQHMSKELNISEDDVEQFIIEIIKTKLVKARIDQTARKVKITSSMSRTFGMKQWQNLSDILHVWRQNLDLVNESLAPLATDPLVADRPINGHMIGGDSVSESARC